MDDVIADKDLLDKIQACQNEIAAAQTRITDYKLEIALNQGVRKGWEIAIRNKEVEPAAHPSSVDAGEVGHTKHASWREPLTEEMASWINAEKIPYYEPAKGGFQRNVFKKDAFGHAFLLLLDNDEKEENLKLVEALQEVTRSNLDLTRHDYNEQRIKDKMKCIEELEVKLPYLQLCTAHGDHAFHMAIGLLSEFYEVYTTREYYVNWSEYNKAESEGEVLNKAVMLQNLADFMLQISNLSH